MQERKNKGDFSQGSIFKHILRLALPYMLAECVHVMYNIVDRMFLGHIPGTGTLALSGVGIVFPIISFINAFAGLWSTGGAPLCSIHRGKGDEEGAHDILETCFTLLLVNAAVIMLLLFPTMKWTLHWMGADESTYGYARDYFSVYLIGTAFTYISLGANPFINMQGNSVMGMMTVLLGAVVNIILDPIFIFVFGMGVKGAAWATVISQFCSAVWVLAFLFSKKTAIRIRKLQIRKAYLGDILSLGVSGFMFKMTNSLTQGVANITLSIFGGTLGTFYIGAMSIINSMREVISLPVTAIAHSAQPVLSYNYGAKLNSRVTKAIRTLGVILFSYSFIAWGIAQLLPKMFISLFTPDTELAALTLPCYRIYFAVFFFMAFQNCGQNTYVALNCPKRAVFFSLFRKVILVVPLTLLLPRLGLGVYGVFWAECLSQFIGGSACLSTMLITVYAKLRKNPDGVAVKL